MAECAPGWESDASGNGNSCYRYMPFNVIISLADMFCSLVGPIAGGPAHLVAINDLDEQEWVT